MTQVCPHCNATVPEDSQRCPACGQEMDVFLTIPPPRFSAAPGPARPAKAGFATGSPSVETRSPAPDTADPIEAARPSAPAPAPKRRLKPRPAPTPEPPRRAPEPPHQPPAAPMAPPQGYYSSPAPAPAPPGGSGGEAAPGKFRRWLINQLGGAAAPTAPAPAAYPYPAPPPQPAYPPAPAQPWSQPLAGAGPAAPPYVPPPSPYQPAPQTAEVATPHLPPSAGEDDDDSRTMAIGADLGKFRIASGRLTLQIFDRNGQWHDWTLIGSGGVKVGRTDKDKAARFPELNSMAVKHMRIGAEGSRIVVEDLGSVNGVYLKLTRPVTLEDGQRFRIGSQVVEFQKAEPLPPCTPLVGEDGELFWCGDSDALAYLQFYRPDGKPGLRFPITKADATIIGRGTRPGRPVDIALPGDELTSGQHAKIQRDGDHFVLEDMNSRNGTFVLLRGQSEILAGDVLLVGRVLLRAVDPLRLPQ